MKRDQMGTRTAHPSPQELLLSNGTRFSLGLRRSDQDDGLGSRALALGVGHTRKALSCLPRAYPTFGVGQGRAAKYMKRLAHPTRFERVTFAF